MTKTILEVNLRMLRVDHKSIQENIRNSLWAIEGFDVYNPVRADEIFLVLDVVVPKKFRVPELVKYTRLECPKTHLRSYCNKMTEFICDEKLLVHFFQYSLTDFTLSWYMTLDNMRIKK